MKKKEERNVFSNSVVENRTIDDYERDSKNEL